MKFKKPLKYENPGTTLFSRNISYNPINLKKKWGGQKQFAAIVNKNKVAPSHGAE